MKNQTAEPDSPQTFDVLPLSRETLEALTSMGYTHPTPVQLAVFEPAARGNDLVVQARTGTGKTAAFGLPIVETGRAPQPRQVQALILCPTRELALQVCAELERLGRQRNIKPVAIYGGAPMGKPDRRARGRAPRSSSAPRAACSITSAAARSTPPSIRMLVLDEADEMLSMGFERELNAILERLPKKRQTLSSRRRSRPTSSASRESRLQGARVHHALGRSGRRARDQHYVYLVARRQARRAGAHPRGREPRERDRLLQHQGRDRARRRGARSARASTPTGSTAISRRASASRS